MPPNGGAAQTETVALMYGPMVLFGIRQPGETGPLNVERNALMDAERTGTYAWMLKSGNGVREMVPFPYVGDRLYSAYFKAAGSVS